MATQPSLPTSSKNTQKEDRYDTRNRSGRTARRYSSFSSFREMTSRLHSGFPCDTLTMKWAATPRAHHKLRLVSAQVAIRGRPSNRQIMRDLSL
ncbi:hypothetical protein TNIN_442191 [Trichonephila inaurata madagascariensis]|uniref:Uncharacterized protein n=1 Tax=Trichonephila inaurata madagascariensis TaxID=2747483 RepID=A0A8X6XFZ7_9ARAC|nr:hypothetical protein TNIN_442191 [Trichonephila inaurata madagascariensis]